MGRRRAQAVALAGVKLRRSGADHHEVVSDASGVAPADDTCWNCGAARGPEPWCLRCLERYERPDPPEPAFAPRRVPAPRSHSRMKGGPTSFGVAGRVAFSIIPGLIAFFAFRNMMRSRGDVTFSYYLVLGLPALVLVVWFLAFVWRRERIS